MTQSLRKSGARITARNASKTSEPERRIANEYIPVSAVAVLRRIEEGYRVYADGQYEFEDFQPCGEYEIVKVVSRGVSYDRGVELAVAHGVAESIGGEIFITAYGRYILRSIEHNNGAFIGHVAMNSLDSFKAVTAAWRKMTERLLLKSKLEEAEISALAKMVALLDAAKS